MRLGELLVEACAVTDDHVAQALVVQRTSRQRLGAALVALGHVGADDIALALARQHGVPAALERHLAKRDEALAKIVPAALAIGLGAVPVAWSRAAGGRLLVVCFRDPWPDHVAEVERATGERVLAAVACESTIGRELARSYAAPDPDSDPAIDVDFDEPSSPRLSLDLVDLDDGRVQRDASQIFERVPTRTAAAPPAAAITLDAAIAGMSDADASDRIADLAIAYLRGAWRGAAILIVREGLALGHRGFGGRLTAASIESLVVPLAQPSVFTAVHDMRRPFAGDPPSGGVAQDRFLRLFADLGPKPIAVVPIAIAERVVSLIFAVAPTGPLVTSVAAMSHLAAAMGEGYQRLIREARTRRASRPPP